MKWILIVSSMFMIACSSSDSSMEEETIPPLDEVPSELRGGWQQACDTEGFDQGYLTTTQSRAFFFEEHSATYLFKAYEGPSCTGPIIASGVDEYPFRIKREFTTQSGLEATLINANDYDAEVMWEYSYYVNGDMLYIGSSIDLDDPFNFDEPFLRDAQVSIPSPISD